MAEDFSKVVSELKTQTVALNKLAGIEQQLAKQGEEIKAQGKDQRRIDAGNKAWQTRQENAQKANAAATEKNRSAERTQNKILGTLKSISGGIGSVASGIGTILKDKTKQVGGDIFGMLKKFAFGAAIAAMLVFLNSKYWEDTKKFIVDDMIPALKNLWENVLSPILTVFKDVFVKQWENVKVLFDDLGASIQKFKDGDILGGITTLIGGLGTFFLNTVDNVLTGVYNLVAGLFGFEGTNSIGMSMFSFILDTWSTITGAFDDVVEWFSGAFTWAKEGLLGAWTSLTDFVSEKWNATKDFFSESYTWAKEGITGTWTSLTDFVSNKWNATKDFFSDTYSWAKEGIAGTWTTLSDFVSSKFKVVTEWFSTVFTDPKAALEQLWKGLVGEGGLVDFLFKPFDDAIAWVQGAFSFGNPEEPFKLTTLVKDAFKMAKEWVVGLFTWGVEAGTTEAGDFSITKLVTEAFRVVKDWITGLFTWAQETGTTEAGDFSILKLVTGAFTSAKEWVTGLFTWSAPSGAEQEFSLSAIVRGALENIWNWFKGLMDIDINAIIKSIPGAETLLSWFTADESSKALAAATESGFYDKDWVGNSEIDRTMVRSVPPEQIQAILADDDISDRDKQFLLDELARRGIEQKAKGGPVQLGKSYIVGENGRELFVPTSDGLIIPDASGASARTNMVANGSITSMASQSAPIVISAPTTNTQISGGGGGRGRIIPMNVSDNDPTLRAIAANTF